MELSHILANGVKQHQDIKKNSKNNSHIKNWKEFKMKNIKLNKTEDKVYKRIFLKISDLKSYLNIGDLGDCFRDYSNGYICDIISEIADNHVYIYNYDLLEWAKDNYGYIEEALDEFGTPTDSRGKTDFIKIIQQGQYYAYEQELYNNLHDNIEYFILDYIEKTLDFEEITETQYNTLKYEIDFEDNNEELENIIEKIDEIIKKEMKHIDFLRTRKEQ